VFNSLEHSVLGISTGGVFSVAFAPDNSRLYIADQSSIRALNLKDRSQETIATGIGAPLALSKDGHYLAAVNREGVRVFQTSPWSGKHTYFRASGPLAFSPDGKSLLTSSRNGFLLWPLEDETDPLTIPATNFFGFFHQSARILTFSADGDRFFAPRDKTINVFDAKSGAQIATLPPDDDPVHHSAIAATALSPDGNILATGSWDHSIQLWDAKNLTHIGSLKGHLNEVWSVAFSPDGKRILSGAKDGGVFLWPLDARKHNDWIAGDWHPTAFSSDEKSIFAVRRRDGTLASIDLQSGAIHEMLNGITTATPRFGRGQGPGAFGMRVSVSANLNVIARITSDRAFEVFNRNTNEKRPITVSEPLIAATLAPNGNAVISTTWGGAVIYYDLKSGSPFPIPARADRGYFTSDSRRIVLLDREGAAAVWNCAERRIENTFNLEIPAGFSCALSPDNRTLAASAMPDLSNTILLVDIVTGKTIGTLFGHKQAVGSVAFSADGRTLASASADGSLKLWNIPTLQEILTLPVQANTAVFSPHGKYMAFNARQNNSEGIQILRASYAEHE
jgi:WD40 repeat protein